MYVSQKKKCENWFYEEIQIQDTLQHFFSYHIFVIGIKVIWCKFPNWFIMIFQSRCIIRNVKLNGIYAFIQNEIVVKIS